MTISRAEVITSVERRRRWSQHDKESSVKNSQAIDLESGNGVLPQLDLPENRP
jgi:hypothetical protein